jgi:hypothetical protein
MTFLVGAKRRFACVTMLLCACLLTSCIGEVPTLTPTRPLSGPTIEPSEAPFAGAPSEAPPEAVSQLGEVDPTAAALPRDSVLPPLAVGEGSAVDQQVEITAEDGTLLIGDLYQTPGERQPGVLLLGTDRSAWAGFPEQLNAAGFTVLVMELRENAPASDFRVMIETLTSGLADPASIAVVGAAAGADASLIGCADVETCDAAALLSPLNANTDAIARYNPRPLYQAVSQEDAESYEAAQVLDQAATGEKLFQPLSNAGRGVAILLNRADVAEQLIVWLGRVLV